MARILTGIQSSGRPHLGNILGAIQPAIALSKIAENECFYFIADLHSLTTIKDAEVRIKNTHATAATWLALGLDTKKNLLYRQSRIPEVCELTWMLNCFTPFPMLANAHSFKEKADKLADVNAGLFTYPVLMASDIIMYDADIVPVGKDQKQHLEMTRDIAASFNHQYGDTFVLPEAKIDENVMTIPGTDGQKMSKSYGNTIDVFLPEKELKKHVMSIITDSTPIEEPKNPDTCNVFALYQIVGNTEQIREMRANYEGGNFGYGHAKTALFELLMNKFSEARKGFDYYLNDIEALESILQDGEARARKIGLEVLGKVRDKLGYS